MTRRTAIAVTLLWAAWPIFGAAQNAHQPPSAVQIAFFESRIRPVLVERCYSCHSATAKKLQGGLRLDSRDVLLLGGDSGPAIVPGDPAASLLLLALKHDGLQMPPNGKLPPAVVADFERWIRDGAADPRDDAKAAVKPASSAKNHWAFQPLRKPSPPAVRDEAWPRTPIDRFIFHKLEELGLRPAKSADPRTLIRRLSFDLLGLPPSPAEVNEFIRDYSRKAENAPSDDASSQSSPSPEMARERAVSSLVDRLLASPHYGERWARHWLDVARHADTKGYVIFGDKEFPWAYTYRDYVVRAMNEDLPFDQFIREQLAADLLPEPRDPRSLAALGFLTVGPRFIDNPHDTIDDRIDVVCRGLMGLTVGCARCHDHKYDPIPTRDYYSLYGVFASCTEPIVPPLLSPPPQTAGYVEYDRELQARVEKLNTFVREKHAALVSSARRRAGEYLLTAHHLRDKPRQDDFMLIADPNDLNPSMIVRWQAFLRRTRQTRDPVFVPWHALAEVDESGFSARAPQLLVELSSPAVNARANPRVLAALAGAKLSRFDDVARIYGELLVEIDDRWQAALRVNPHVSVMANAVDEPLRQVLYGPGSPPQIPLVNPWGDLDLIPDRASQGTWRELLKAIETHRAAGPHAPPRAMSLEDLAIPYEPRVFVRGNPNQLGENAPRGFLEVLTGKDRQLFRQGSGRLELAQAIADPRNPLTARVIVNRVWLHHFGSGLVRTPSDFGLRSEPPTHPELLEYLASTFIEQGWSLKKLHRTIVMSSVYRQSSVAQSAPANDPDNRLLARMNRRRLEFESLRDALLAVGDGLDRELGGPAIKESVLGNNRRRTLYGFLDRYSVPSVFRTFDFPSPDSSNPQRDVTTVAPQALFLMNHSFVRSCAQRLLRAPEIASERDAATRIERVYGRLFGRSAGADEVELARAFLTTTPSNAAWEQYVHALLMSDEFAFVD